MVFLSFIPPWILKYYFAGFFFNLTLCTTKLNSCGALFFLLYGQLCYWLWKRLRNNCSFIIIFKGHITLDIRFLAIFVGGPHCLWCPKSRWSPPLCASIALKTGKNGLKVRKLWPSPSKGGRFYKKISIEQIIAYFRTPQKRFKHYSIAFRDRRWFLKLKMMISRSNWTKKNWESYALIK
jgi:hypothetical protein